MPITIPELRDWTLSIDFERIAWAVADREGESMNALGRRPMEELEKIVSVVEGAEAGDTGEYFEFRPDGSASDGTVVVSNDKGDRQTIRIIGATGRVFIEDETEETE